MNPNLLDIIIFLILIVLFVRGLMVGFFRSSFSVIALILGFYVATYYYDEVLDLLDHLAPNLPFSNIISFAAVFLVVYIVIRLVGASLVRLFNASFFGKSDKFLGALLGLAKGILLVSFITVSLTHLLPSNSSLLQKSRLKGYTLPICRAVVQVVPKKFKNDFLNKSNSRNKREGSASTPKPAPTPNHNSH